MNDMTDTSRVALRRSDAGPPIPDDAPHIPSPKDIAAPLAAIPEIDGKKIFKLSAPIKIPDGRMVSEVALKFPTGMDLFEIGGLPAQTIWVQGGMKVEMDAERFKKWLSRLSDWDIVTLYHAPARDLRTMYEWLVGELNPAGN